MNTNKLGAVSALLCLLACSTPVFAQGWKEEPDSFRSVPWGSTEEAAKVFFPNFQCGEVPPSTPLWMPQTYCNGQVLIGSVSTDTTLYFRDDKFVTVFMAFPESDYSFMRGVFTEKYGLPHKHAEAMLQNRMGATAQNETLTWAGKIVSIELVRYSGKLTDSSAFFSVNTFTEASDEAKRKEKQTAKDAF